MPRYILVSIIFFTAALVFVLQKSRSGTVAWKRVVGVWGVLMVVYMLYELIRHG